MALPFTHVSVYYSTVTIKNRNISIQNLELLFKVTM